jgi:hypothetical protein
MPSRILREGILTSERVNSLGWEAEVFYRRLMSVVDDYGRFSAHPKLLRAALYPLKLDAVRDANMERLLAFVEQARLVRVYEVTGKRYLEMLDFRQTVRAKESKYPAPGEADAPLSGLGGIPGGTHPGDACAASATHVHSTCTTHAPPMRSTCEASAPVFGDGDVIDKGKITKHATASEDIAGARALSAAASPPGNTATGHSRAGAVCAALRTAGIAAVNQSHPQLLALLAEGVTDAQFADAARITAERGKGFAYLLATVRGQREDAQRAATTGTAAGTRAGPAKSFVQLDREAGMARWEQMTGQRHPDRDRGAQPPPVVIDADAAPKLESGNG